MKRRKWWIIALSLALLAACQIISGCGYREVKIDTSSVIPKLYRGMPKNDVIALIGKKPEFSIEESIFYTDARTGETLHLFFNSEGLLSSAHFTRDVPGPGDPKRKIILPDGRQAEEVGPGAGPSR
jgi:hypothetical protein